MSNTRSLSGRHMAVAVRTALFSLLVFFAVTLSGCSKQSDPTSELAEL